MDWLFSRQYDEKHYNCFHFTAEVWKALTGEAIEDRLGGLLGLLSGQGASVVPTAPFLALAQPLSPSLAIMRRPRSTPHVGIYLERKILHIQPRGVEFQPPEVAALGFTRINYYK